ncbi:hypothetical protein DM02DRAFT_187876 [Periconia macrospinosa]|uniref:Uncharacterized protein n=1 Tax=Periconia macrospinosa TaxID=97972 RepID=A0A2V1E2A7_9PLEO|nr:hypothetical protein DM02DRAFT_187876 [Periconia macrospinosa]
MSRYVKRLCVCVSSCNLTYVCVGAKKVPHPWNAETKGGKKKHVSLDALSKTRERERGGWRLIMREKEPKTKSRQKTQIHNRMET